MDFVGLAERDYDQSYRFFSKDGEQSSLIYGFDPRRLTPDIHFEKGLICIDCHTSKDIMGDGKIYAHSMEQVAIRCQDCHGTPQNKPRTKPWLFTAKPSQDRKAKAVQKEIVLDSKGNPMLQVKKEGQGFFLVSKSDQVKHKIPLISDGTGRLIPPHPRAYPRHGMP